MSVVQGAVAPAASSAHAATQADALRAAFDAVRLHTERLVAPLSPEDCCVQSMPDASPAKWHLAHTTWFFETFVLERWEPGFAPFAPVFRVLFNSYYESVGERHPRHARGLLTRPSLAEVQAYRSDVDQRMRRLLQRDDLPASAAELITLGLHHEQQHQELLLTDIQHLLAQHPLGVAYTPPGAAVGAPPRSAPGSLGPLNFHRMEGGLVEIGHDTVQPSAAFAFDNEGPRHRVYLAPYAIADRLVTHGEYLAFITEGGYQNPLLWLSEGWAWRQATGRAHPIYWHPPATPGAPWQCFGLHGLQPLNPAAPVTQLSYYEADAFARWCDARLPSEAEWEHAVAQLGVRPGEGVAANTADAAAGQWFGAVWQWTHSSYGAYPGFRTAAGAVGEYNGKFMVNQYVLRGSSCATPPGHARRTYRNFFPASACWQFTGLRLARDAHPAGPGSELPQTPFSSPTGIAGLA